MKKHLFALSALVALTLNSNAQNGNASANANAQWKITGNSASTSDFIGTTNNQSLIFKTNNIVRGSFDTQGKFIWDGGGEVIIHPGGMNRPTPTNPIAAFMLKVGGSGIFDGELNARQLFVEEYITFMKSLKGPAINVDSIKMDSTRGIYGNTRVFGDVAIKQNLEVTGDAVFKQSLYAQTIKVGDVLNNVDISVQTAPNGSKLLGFGYSGRPIPTGINSCVTPFTGPNSSNFLERTVITTADLTQPVFDFRNSGLNGTIDYGFDYIKNPDTQAQRTGPTTIPSIKINGSCYGDVELAKGGGFVSTGKWFEVGNPVTSYKVASNIFGRSEIGQRVAINSPIPDGTTASGIPIYYNTQLFINKNDTRALSVFNTKTNTNGDETFTIYGDGKTAIGTNYIPAGYFLAVKGKIISEEVVVQLRSNWPDYVFNKDYKLTPLKEVEDYIAKNKHLQNIPSAVEIEKDGVTLGNVVSKQMEKIEELTLYLIDQQKQIEELKKQIELLKK